MKKLLGLITIALIVSSCGPQIENNPIPEDETREEVVTAVHNGCSLLALNIGEFGINGYADNYGSEKLHLCAPNAGFTAVISESPTVKGSFTFIAKSTKSTAFITGSYAAGDDNISISISVGNQFGSAYFDPQTGEIIFFNDDVILEFEEILREIIEQFSL